MPRARKTIDVERVRILTNTYLELSKDDKADERLGAARLLEEVLMETNNYHGFGYRDGWPCDDESRRFYY